MKGEKAVEIFEIIKRQKMLPGKMEELVPISFIGQTAVKWYRDKIKLMKQLNMTEEQRKSTLKDGQDAGEMLLDIENRIGELAYSEPRETHKGIPQDQRNLQGKGGKHERLGLKKKQMHISQTIHKNPKIVEKVKAQAKENEDIPTKTAVLTEIKYQKEKARRQKAEANKTENKAVITIEQKEYINALERCIRILPQKPPKRWDQQALREVKSYAKIIIKRLEVFIDG